jgi:uncharacterized protein YqcC (DUF446 family)
MDKYSLIGNKATEIEDELKRINRWESAELPPEKFENMGAFGCNTMTFEQWIQFVLLQRIHQVIEAKSQFPAQSQVGTYAIRNFGGDADADNLVQLLNELDDLIIQ